MKKLLIIIISLTLIVSAVPTVLADAYDDAACVSSGSFTAYLNPESAGNYSDWYAWTWGQGTDRWVTGEFNGSIYRFDNLDSNVVFAGMNGGYEPSWSSGAVNKQTVDVALDGVNKLFVATGENADGKLTGYLTAFNDSDWRSSQTTEPSSTNEGETPGSAYSTPTAQTSETDNTGGQFVNTDPEAPTDISHKPTGQTQPSIIKPTTESSDSSSSSNNVESSSKGGNTPTPQKPKLNLKSATVKCGKVITLKVSNKGANKTTYSSNNKKTAKVNSNGKVTALRKGLAKITVNVGGVKLYFTIKVTTSPKLCANSVTVKKGKYKSVRIIGKASTVNNSYTNTPKAKIVSKKTTAEIRVKGLKKGSTVLKVRVNGCALRLKVKVK